MKCGVQMVSSMELNTSTQLMERYIKESYQRCKQRGIDVKAVPSCISYLEGQDLQRRVDMYSDAISITKIFSNRLIDLLAQDGVAILLTDSDDMVLEYFGCEVMQQQLESLGLKPGARFVEEICGTSSVILANRFRMPVALVAEEHYHKTLHKLAWYSAPFYFAGAPLSGVLTIITKAEGHTNYRLALLESLVHSLVREYEMRQNYRRQRMVNSIMTGNTNNGIILLDKRGNITEYNPVAEEILGSPKREVLGTSYQSLNFIPDLVSRSIRTMKNIEGEYMDFGFSDGTKKRVVLDIIHILDGLTGNCYKGTYIQLRDITEKYELEQQIIMSERFSAIGKLAAGLAHEIRNPLTSVMGFMQILGNTKDYSKMANYYGIMLEELSRVKQLVSDFVVVSKPSAPNKTEVCLKDFLDDTLMMMESQAILKDVNLVGNYNLDGTETVLIDPSQMKQVLINTIQNAIEASETKEKQGEVELFCTINVDIGEVCISIKDNGCGMTEEELRQVLTPFFTTKDSGTGLGMSVTYRIVESHRGKMKIDSKKGEGTRVDIILPY